MEVYLLEIYENKDANVPDFGLVFKTMELLLRFVEQHIKKIQPENIEYANELKETGLALSLDEEETVRVTILPVIEDVADDKYNDYITGKKTKSDEHIDTKKHNSDKNKDEHNDEKEHNSGKNHNEHTDGDHNEHNKNDDGDDEVEITESKDVLELPAGTENSITTTELKEGDEIIDFFHNKDNHNDPKFMLKSSFDKLPSPKTDPWSRVPIIEATTYKIKLKSKNNVTQKKKNGNNREKSAKH